MRCKNCNTEVKAGMKFCPKCGKELFQLVTCNHCRAQINAGLPYCPNCGARQNEQIAEPRPITEVAQDVILQEKMAEEHVQEEHVQELNEPDDVTTTKPSVSEIEPTLSYEDDQGSKKWLWIVGVILLLGILGGGGYYFISNKGNSSIETDSIADISNSIITDIHSAEGIKSRLNEIFTKGLHMSNEEAVKKFFSQEFRQLYSKVDEIDNTIYAGEIGYWNGSIWDGSQDDQPNGYEIVRVSISSPSEALIDVNLLSDYEGRHNEQKVSLFLVFENDNWFIDDILDFRYKETMKEHIDFSKKESPISIKELRSVSPDKTLPQQGFSYTTYSVREGYETEIWYKNCEIDKDRNIHSVKENACVVELFDGMSASLRITVFDKNIYETVKEQVLEYSVKTENGYCFKWNKDEMSHLSMGESDYFEGGHFIDISITLISEH